MGSSGGVISGADLPASITSDSRIAFNVKGPAYGAKGDGVADDAAAINACELAAAAAKAPVYFPPGTYRTGSTLRINRTGAMWFGDGPLNSIITGAFAGILVDYGQAVYDGSVTQELPVFAGLQFSLGAGITYGLWVRTQSVRGVVRDCLFQGTYGAGVGIGTQDVGVNPSEVFGWTADNTTFRFLAKGAELRGAAQSWRFTASCRIFYCSTWGVDAQRETGGTGGGRLRIDADVESCGDTLDTTGCIRLGGLDSVLISLPDGEMGGSHNFGGAVGVKQFLGCVVLIDNDGAGNPSQNVTIDGGHMQGSGAAAKSIRIVNANVVNLKNLHAYSFTTGDAVESGQSGVSIEGTAAAINQLNEDGCNWQSVANKRDVFVGPVDPRRATQTGATMVANTAYAQDFEVDEAHYVTNAFFAVCQRAGGETMEIAVYDRTSTARVATTGNFAVPVVGEANQALTAGVWLRPGRRYRMVCVVSAATAAITGLVGAAGSRDIADQLGILRSAAGIGSPLPANFSPAVGAPSSTAYCACFN